MTNNDEILEMMQTIAGIFAHKRIPTMPVNLDYLETRIAPDQERLVMRELILELEERLLEYKKFSKREYKYARYLAIFKVALNDNAHGNQIIARKVA